MSGAPEEKKGGGDRQGGEKKKKESILDLSKYLDKTIRVKFSGGRESSGVLKGFDPLLNLVRSKIIQDYGVKSIIGVSSTSGVARVEFWVRAGVRIGFWLGIGLGLGLG